MIRPTFIDTNPVELKYYVFMIILDKFSEINSILLPKIYVTKKT